MADSTLAQIGSLTALAYWNVSASPDAWADLGPILSITGAGQERSEVDSTTLDSTSVERIGGLPDGKEMTITFTAATTSVDLVEGFVITGTPIDLRLTFPAPLGETRYFTLQPLSFEYGDIAPSELIEIELGGRITGDFSSTPSHP